MQSWMIHGMIKKQLFHDVHHNHVILHEQEKQKLQMSKINIPYFHSVFVHPKSHDSLSHESSQSVLLLLSQDHHKKSHPPSQSLSQSPSHQVLHESQSSLHKEQSDVHANDDILCPDNSTLCNESPNERNFRPFDNNNDKSLS